MPCVPKYSMNSHKLICQDVFFFPGMVKKYILHCTNEKQPKALTLNYVCHFLHCTINTSPFLSMYCNHYCTISTYTDCVDSILTVMEMEILISCIKLGSSEVNCMSPPAFSQTMQVYFTRLILV